MYDKLSEDRILLLHPSIRVEALTLLNQAETLIDSNLKIRVVQGLRTIEQQNKLYAQGRTAPGSKVTNARGGSSYHNYGLAIDLCWLIQQADRSYKFSDTKSWNFGPNFRKIVALFKEHGWVYGGDWLTPDKPHFEKSPYNWRELYKRYKAGNIDDKGYVIL